MIIKGILHNRKAVKDFYQNFRKLHAKMFIGATLRVDDFNLTEGIMAYTVTAVITMVVKSSTGKFLMRYEETIGRTKVEVTNEEVTQTIYYEAMMMGQDGQALIKQYEETGYLPAIKMSMLEQKVMTHIFSKELEEE